MDQNTIEADRATEAGATHPGGTIPSRWEVFVAVVRRALPRVAEATLVPAALFYACTVLLGIGAAFVAALGWSYGALAWRALTRRPIPPILALATAALTVRTALALASGSTFVYFVQPVAGTMAMALVFLASIATSRPLVARLAGDFWPLSPEMSAHPAVVRLFRLLTLLWAAVNVATAVTTFVLLVTLPVAAYLPAKTLSGYAITLSGIALTISLSVGTARRHGLTAAGVPWVAITPSR